MGLDISVYKPVEPNTPDSTKLPITEYTQELSMFSSLFSIEQSEIYDLESALHPLDINSLELVSVDYNQQGTIFTFEDESNKQMIISNPQTKPDLETFLYVKEIGYQRKGANSKFYSDNIWDSPPITSKKLLQKHLKEYFSINTPSNEGGWGFSVEYNQRDKEMKHNFKNNILSKFVEGETFVLYH